VVKLEVAAAAVVIMNGFVYHLAADETQQDEGYPVVDADYVRLKLLTQQPTDNGHQSLKSTEIQGYDAAVAQTEFFHAQSLAHGDGAGVHTKTDADKKQLC